MLARERTCDGQRRRAVFRCTLLPVYSWGWARRSRAETHFEVLPLHRPGEH